MINFDDALNAHNALFDTNDDINLLDSPLYNFAITLMRDAATDLATIATNARDYFSDSTYNDFLSATESIANAQSLLDCIYDSDAIDAFDFSLFDADEYLN